MQSFFERQGPKLDTSLPSIRHIQDLIRRREVVRVQLLNGDVVDGSLPWQDHQFIALQQAGNRPLMLIQRSAIAVIRALP